MKLRLPLLVFVLYLLMPLNGWSSEDPQQKPKGQEQVPVEDIIPVTMGNLRGHKMLYEEGWYIVTSSSKALDYAKEKSIVSSKTALQRMAREIAGDSASYKESVKADARDSFDTGRELVTGGTRLTGEIVETTHSIAKEEFSYAGDRFKKAMETFVRGNLTIAKRTEEERRELAGLPGNYFSTLKSDFSNLFELSDKARKQFSAKIDPAWEDAFRKASREFRAEYEESGKKQNSLQALGPILAGYLKSLYHGLVAPASKTIVKTTVAGTSYVVFLPVSATSIIAGRTVQSIGLTVYYVGKTGVKIVSPTIESGFLAGLSLLSVSSVPVTYAAGGSLGVVNQVAFTAAGPVAATAEGVGSTAVHTAGYAGFLAFDAVKGTTQVIINQAASGIVLGYNALTAIPSHAFMGALDTAVFLAWDGPRLVIAAAKGRIKSGKDPDGESYSLGDLPVGTVVDLKELEKQEGVQVEILSTDSTVIKNVLDKIPSDVRAE
jgi:hypothetical protein